MAVRSAVPCSSRDPGHQTQPLSLEGLGLRPYLVASRQPLAAVRRASCCRVDLRRLPATGNLAFAGVQLKLHTCMDDDDTARSAENSTCCGVACAEHTRSQAYRSASGAGSSSARGLTLAAARSHSFPAESRYTRVRPAGPTQYKRSCHRSRACAVLPAQHCTRTVLGRAAVARPAQQQPTRCTAAHVQRTSLSSGADWLVLRGAEVRLTAYRNQLKASGLSGLRGRRRRLVGLSTVRPKALP